MFPTWSTLQSLAPEIVLVLTACLLLVGSAFRPSRKLWGTLAIVACLVAAYVLILVSPLHEGPDAPGQVPPGGLLLFDPLSAVLRWAGLALAALFVLIAWRYAEPSSAGETFGCVLLVASGILLAAGANELVLLFVSLELVSIPTYVLLLLGRRDRAAGEAAMKYFFLSIVASVLLLYGLTLLYGLAGTTRLAGTPQTPGLRELLRGDLKPVAGPLAPLAPLAVVLLAAGLGFRLTIAPWQFYAPDVYQGTTNVNAGLLAVAPKLVGVLGLIRLLLVAMPSAAGLVWQLALVLALVTMTLGNVAALWQRHLRRLMAYSSIAHGGYLLIGLAAAAAALGPGAWPGPPEAPGQAAAGVPAPFGGVAAMVLYLLVYGLATAGLFAALVSLGSVRRELEHLEELSGLARTDPLLAACMAVLLFSLAGLPPLAGFWGKLQLFLSAVGLATAEHADAPAISRWFAILAVAGVLNAAIAAAYYLRIIAVMYFQPSVVPPAAEGGRAARGCAVACAVLVVVLGAWPGGLVRLTARAEQGLHAVSAVPSANLPDQTAPHFATSARPADPRTRAPNAFRAASKVAQGL